MLGVTKLTTTEDVTMIHLSNIPRDLKFLTEVLGLFAKEKINIDMISQTTFAQNEFDFSFTVPGVQLQSTLSIVSKIKNAFPTIRISATTGNTKVEIYGEEMRTTHGVAYHAIQALAEKNIPVSMITTSEVDISLLFASADQYTAIETLQQAFSLEAEEQA